MSDFPTRPASGPLPTSTIDAWSAGAQRKMGRAIFHGLRQPVAVLGDGKVVEAVNPAFCRSFRTTSEAVVGQSFFALGGGRWDIPELRHLLDGVGAYGLEVMGFRIEGDFGDAGRRTILLDAVRIEVEGGAQPHVMVTMSDVTVQERLSFELEAQKEFAEMTVDAVRDPLLVLDLDLRVQTANQPFYEAFGVGPDETEGKQVYQLGNGQWNIPRLRELLEDVLPDNRTFDDFEVEHEFERIGQRVMLLNARRMNHHQLILLAIEDVTERRRSESQQKVMMGELQHRVKNILMNVRALARHTRRSSGDMEAFAAKFDGRLDSLARTQDLLLKSSGDAVPLEEIVRLELSARGVDDGDGDRFELRGPFVQLPARAAQPMAMTIHELATNAAKYGALAHADGRILVSWHIDRDDSGKRLHLEWRERGVPIGEPPARQGFGSQVIRTSLPYLFGGHCTLNFEADGAVCVLDMPLPAQ